MYEFITSNEQDGIAIVTLNRPERLNAMGTAMGREFDAVMVGLALNREVRAVIVTGAGRAFCSGADMERLTGFAAGDENSSRLPTEVRAGGPYKTLEDVAPAEVLNRYASPQALPKLVIAAVNGPCAGIGLALAAMSDVRFASTNAFFTAPFAQRGLIAEAALAGSLSALVGFGAAADILLSGRRVLADEAQRIGLVQAVCDPEKLITFAIDYARAICDGSSPRSIRIIKRQLWNARSSKYSEIAQEALTETKKTLGSDDFKEGIAHFRERRRPRFTGE